MPAIGAVTVASAIAFSSVAICASAAATRARAASTSSRRAPARSRRRLRAPRARGRCAPGTRSRRHVPPRHRIVALLARSGVRTRAAPRSARRRLAPRPSSASAARRRRRAVARLRFGLADVLRRERRRAASRSCASACWRSARARASASSRVRRVEPRHEIAGLDAIAFGDAQLEQRVRRPGPRPARRSPRPGRTRARDRRGGLSARTRAGRRHASAASRTIRGAVGVGDAASWCRPHRDSPALDVVQRSERRTAPARAARTRRATARAC